MIEILKRNDDKTFEVISPIEIEVGNEFQIGYNSTTKEAVILTVSEIIEQRKSKGKFKDQSKIPFWAKVK